jgi:hypothetical protein
VTGRQEGPAGQARDVCLGGSLTRGSEKRLHLGRRGQLDHPQVGSIAIKSGFETRPTVDRVTPHPPQERQIESLGASGCLDVSTVDRSARSSALIKHRSLGSASTTTVSARAKRTSKVPP